MKRRTFLKQTAAATAIGPSFAVAQSKPKTFNLWACGDCHVGTDLKRGRESLAKAIRQSEFGGDNDNRHGPPFDWDIAVHVGDYSGNQGSPTDEDSLPACPLSTQWRATLWTLRSSLREPYVAGSIVVAEASEMTEHFPPFIN